MLNSRPEVTQGEPRYLQEVWLLSLAPPKGLSNLQRGRDFINLLHGYVPAAKTVHRTERLLHQFCIYKRMYEWISEQIRGWKFKHRRIRKQVSFIKNVNPGSAAFQKIQISKDS